MAERYWYTWAKKAYEILNYIIETQINNIDKASDIISRAIINGHVCFLFGSGHAAIPVMEMFPRYGTFLGFIPIVDTPLISFLRMVGDLGYPQFDFIENSPEYGRRIILNYEIHKEDCGIIFSHSGSTPISIEIALQLKNRGAKVIGVTSLAHAKIAKSRHPSNLRLFEVSDIVIDTGVPPGDVSIEIKIRETRIAIGPLSTFAFVIVSNLLILKTFEKLLNVGYIPEVFPVRSMDPEADIKMDRILRMYRKLYSEHLKYTQ
ncbi:MAG: sugar isomerase domain-containing protein [Desulfurococcaceae archaeon]